MTAFLPLTLLAQSIGGLAGMQPFELAAPDVVANDKFGYSVALDDSTIAIGAIGQDERGDDSGSVYIYVRVEAKWELQEKLVPTDLQAGDWFGHSVALLADTLVVGASRDDDVEGNSGSVYVFERSGVSWAQSAKLHASDPGVGAWFGHDVALTHDRLVVGSWGDDERGVRSGAAYAFVRTGASGLGWREEAKLTASDAQPSDDFGRAVCIEGLRIVVGKRGDRTNGKHAGAAYVYDLIGSDWVEVAKLLPADGAGSDNFGSSVSLSHDRVIIGSPAADDAGASSGAAYVFQRDDGVWSQVSKLLPSDGNPGAQFGFAVAILRERILVGASNDSAVVAGGGAAYEFIRGAESWLQVSKFTTANSAQMDSFGWDLGIGERGFVSGSQNRDDVGDNAGAAYLFGLRDQFVHHCHGDVGDQTACPSCSDDDEFLPRMRSGRANPNSHVAEPDVSFVVLDSMRSVGGDGLQLSDSLR